MGYVKDWSNMLEAFFQEDFFEARWTLFAEEIPSGMMKSGIENVGRLSSEKKADEDFKRAWEKQIQAERRRSLSFDDGRDFAVERFWKADRKADRKADALGRGSEDAETVEYDFERLMRDAEDFEKMLGSETDYIYREGRDASLAVMYVAEHEADGLSGYDAWSKARGEAGGYGQGIKLGRDSVEKILNGVKEETHGQSHEIKIEMVRNNSGGEEFDIDEALDALTERLCNLMAKGADGIYL